METSVSGGSSLGGAKATVSSALRTGLERASKFYSYLGMAIICPSPKNLQQSWSLPWGNIRTG